MYIYIYTHVYVYLHMNSVDKYSTNKSMSLYHPPLSKYHMGNSVFEAVFLELVPSSLFNMDLAFHVPILHLYLISSQILIDTSLISVCQRSISLFYQGLQYDSLL